MAEKQRSLVLITVDCLRADHCGFYGYARPTTPFLDSLAAESCVVPAAVVAGAPTYYSLPAVLASRMPLALGRDVVGLAPGEETLATVLHSVGYATAAFIAANPYIAPRFGYDQGFDVFQDFHDFDNPSAHDEAHRSDNTGSGRAKLNQWLRKSAHAVGMEKVYSELYFQYCQRIVAPEVKSMEALRRFPSADVVVASAEAWLASVGPRPFFLWIHLMDPHSPYYPPAAAYEEFTGKEVSSSRARYLNEFWNRSDLEAAAFRRHKEAIVELYDAGIRCADGQIGRLVSFLKRTDRWDDCVFSVTADHGEEFLEHGRRYHAPVSAVEEVQRVPLLLRMPGQPKVNPTDAPFSHLHLAPTLLEMVDVPVPPGFRGESLWRRLQQGRDATGPAIAECVDGCTNPFRAESRMAARLLSVRDARYKLVIRLEAGAAEEIFDLQLDPAEQRPLAAGSAPDVRKHLLEIARQHMDKPVVDSDTKARLRARLRDIRLELGA